MKPPPGLVITTDFEGLVFRPRREIAMVREELEGRLEVLSSDGELTHRPGPLAALEGPPFVQVATGTLVNPRFARPVDGGLQLPGGWVVAGRLPAEPPEEEPLPDPRVETAGVLASQVLYVDGSGPSGTSWVTDRGRVPGPEGLTGALLAKLHPDLRLAAKGLYVNPMRIRFLRRGPRYQYPDLVFDDGSTLSLYANPSPRLCQSLGLADHDTLGGETPGQHHLRRLGMRRWPFPLASASAEFLAREFPGQPGRLLCNLAMQTVEAVAAGVPVLDGDGHRPWFYRPGRPMLERAGHMRVSPRRQVEEPEAATLWTNYAPAPPPRAALLAAEEPRGRKPRREKTYPTFRARLPLNMETAWSLVCTVWTHLVGEARLFTYRRAGFRDEKPEGRLIGTPNPQLVVLVEKDELAERAMELHRQFGVTLFVTGGYCPLIGAEYLAEDLRARGVDQVDIVSYSDYDLVGWDLPEMLAGQLARYDLPTGRIARMVTPDRFTAEELATVSMSLELSRNPSYLSRLRRWVEETGGIGGLPRGIQADHLFPLDRVVAAFLAVAGGWLEG